MINKLVLEKRELTKKWQQSRYPPDKTKLNRATKNLKQVLKTKSENDISHYLKNLSATAETNYSIWKATKKLLNKTIHQPPIRKENGNWARTNEEKAATLADNYAEIFSSSTTPNTFPFASERTHTQDYKLRPVTTREIQKIIKTDIKPKKSPGFDKITGLILKQLPSRAITYIRNIFNAMFRLKYFPKVWKIAEIIAIPKPGKDPAIASSYRPISLLPIMSKIFEKLLIVRIRPIIGHHKVIPDHQFGFRQKHSTIQQIHRVSHKILSELDAKKFCVGIYLDIEKAFDKVWHKGLITKLKLVLPNNICKLLESYITDRHFYVKFNDNTSSLRKITAGIPQGSVLGPLLYNLYTADIPVPTDVNAMLATFADDTVLLYGHRSLAKATKKMQQVFNKTKEWFDSWNIKINALKTQQVIYTTKRNFIPRNVTINGTPIPTSLSAKYLGIHLDSKLLWKHHIKNKKDQIKNRFKQLYWLLNKNSTLSLYNKVLIYKTIIKPIWTYGIQLWGTAKKSNTNIIQRQQSKILRIITGAPRYISNHDLHRELDITTIKEEITKVSRKYQATIETHCNNEVNVLPTQELMRARRLQRKRPIDLI